MIYEILIDNNKVAECYSLDDATIIIQAYCLYRFEMDQFKITLRAIRDE